jgi:phosphatidate cytidylyltransferase
MKRVLTALALIPIVGWVVLAANSWIFLGVLVIASCLCYREYDDIAAAYGFGAPGVAGYGMGLLLLLLWNLHWAVMAGITIAALIMVMREKDLANALPRAALLVLGVVYIFGCWRCARPLREISPHWLMYALMLNWVGDIGAYYVGRTFGEHKLAPRVSPNKSWEGSVASVITSTAVGTLYLHLFLPAVPLAAAVGLTIVANIAGQFGDLAESTMKRGANVKDSGGILPGHGGFLDRVDSTLFALPVVYGFLLLVH